MNDHISPSPRRILVHLRLAASLHRQIYAGIEVAARAYGLPLRTLERFDPGAFKPGDGFITAVGGVGRPGIALEHVEEHLTSGVRTVSVLSEPMSARLLPSVRPDPVACGDLVGRYFQQHGDLSIAYVTRSSRQATDREMGMAKWVGVRRYAWRSADRGRIAPWLAALPPDAGLVVEGSGIYEQISQWLPPEQRFRLLSLGDDPAFFESITPSISAVDLAADVIGQQAVALLRQPIWPPLSPPALIPPAGIIHRSSTQQTSDPLLSEMAAIIAETAPRRLSVAEVAATMGRSRRDLERHVHARTGRGPLQWIGRHTAAAIKRQHDASDSPTAVAHAAGFKDVAALRRYLKRWR